MHCAFCTDLLLIKCFHVNVPASGGCSLYPNVTVRGGAGGGTFSICSCSLDLSTDGRLDKLSSSRRAGSRGELVLALLPGW
jgi:hypothetical protein